MTLRKGNRVSHPLSGLGTVCQVIAQSEAVVQWDLGGTSTRPIVELRITATPKEKK